MWICYLLPVVANNLLIRSGLQDSFQCYCFTIPSIKKYNKDILGCGYAQAQDNCLIELLSYVHFCQQFNANNNARFEFKLKTNLIIPVLTGEQLFKYQRKHICTGSGGLEFCLFSLMQLFKGDSHMYVQQFQLNHIFTLITLTFISPL